MNKSYYDGEQTWKALPLSSSYSEADVLRKNAAGDELDPEEYLILVRAMSRSVPDVMTSDVEPSKYYEHITAVSVASQPVQLTSDLQPSVEWQNHVLQSFKDLRETIAAWEAIREGGPAFGALLIPEPSIPPPRIASLPAWREYCFGEPNEAAKVQSPQQPVSTAGKQFWFAPDNDDEIADDDADGDCEGGDDAGVDSGAAASSKKRRIDDGVDDDDAFDDGPDAGDENVDDVVDDGGGSGDVDDGTGAGSSSLSSAAVQPSTKAPAQLQPMPPLLSALLKYDQLMVVRLLNRLLKHHTETFSLSSPPATSTASVPIPAITAASRPLHPPTSHASASSSSSMQFKHAVHIGAAGDIELRSRSAISKSTLVTSSSCVAADSGAGSATISAASASSPSAPAPEASASSVGQRGYLSLPGVITVPEASWLYALLARLEVPLLGSVAATIRELFLLFRRQRAVIAGRIAALESEAGAAAVGSAADASDTLAAAASSSSSSLPPSSSSAGASLTSAALTGPALHLGPLLAQLAGLDTLVVVTARYFNQRLPGE